MTHYAWIVLLAASLAAGPAAAQSTTGAGGDAACVGCGQSFAGQDLRGKNFSHQNLRGSDFSNAKLDGATFAGAELRGANFSGASFGRYPAGAQGAPTRFSGADLQQANFAGADLAATDFQYARLGCADFSGSDFTHSVTGPALDLAPPHGTICSASFKGATLSCERGFARANPAELAGSKSPACGAAAAVAAGVTCGAADLSGLTSQVYVSSTGADSASCGQSTSSPCATIQQGISLCSGSGCGVLVEWGQFSLSQSIALKTGVSVYGGCLWSGTGSPTYQSQIGPPAGGLPSFTATSVSPGYLQGFLLSSSAATAAGAPSIVLSMIGSTGPTLANLTISAGNGAPGAPGATGGQGATGASGSGTSPGSSSCSAAGGNGGAGGTADLYWDGLKQKCSYDPGQNGGNGQPGSTGISAAGGRYATTSGSGCTSSSCSGKCQAITDGDSTPTGGTGTGGTQGTCGQGGSAATALAGTFTANGWAGVPGGNGTAGGSGGGGGGGGAGLSCGISYFPGTGQDFNGGSGGGGGAGGCGGYIGYGGGQGGASIAVLAIQSTLTFGSQVQMAGGNGGQGGTGGGGGNGGGIGNPGWAAGTGNCATNGGNGGYGGNGGAAGGGAGGNGGPSILLALISSPSPAGVNGATFTLGNPGGLGSAGQSGTWPCSAGAPQAGAISSQYSIYTSTVSN